MEKRHHRRDAAGTEPPRPYTITDGPAPAGVTVVVLEGEIDVAAAPALHERLQAAPDGEALVLDLAEVTFVDSAALRELLQARAALPERGVRLVLAGVPPTLRRLLELTHMGGLFDEAPDVESALTRLSR